MELVREALASGFFRKTDTAIIIHDLDALEAGFTALGAVFPPTTLTAVAVKANPLPPLIALLAKRGAGAEVASLPELRLALAAGVPPERIVFDSPAKTREELREAVRLGVHVNADNLDELDRLAELTAEPGMRARHCPFFKADQKNYFLRQLIVTWPGKPEEDVPWKNGHPLDARASPFYSFVD